jgi:hypothetical protein
MKKQLKPGDLFNAMQAKKKKRGLRPASAVAKSEQDASHKMYKKSKKKNFIADAIKHPGMLHKELGIKAGKKIPAKTLSKAASKGGKLGQRARFAQTLKGLKKNKKGKTSSKYKKEATKKKLSATGGAYVRNYSGFGKGANNAKTLAPAMPSGNARYEGDNSGGQYIMNASGSNRVNAIAKMAGASGYGKTMKKRKKNKKTK